MSKGIDFCSHYLILHYYKHSKLFYIFLLTFFLLATLSQFTVIQYLQNILWASNNYRGQSYLGRRKPKERKMKKLFFLIVRTQLFGSNITAAMPVYFCLWLSDPIYSFNSYLVISCNIGMALQYISTIFYGCNTQKKKKNKHHWKIVNAPCACFKKNAQVSTNISQAHWFSSHFSERNPAPVKPDKQ